MQVYAGIFAVVSSCCRRRDKKMRLAYFLLIKDETEIKMPVTFVKSNLNLQQPSSGQNLVVVVER